MSIFLNNDTSIFCFMFEGAPIEKCSCVRDLSTYVSSPFNFKFHVSSIVPKANCMQPKQHACRFILYRKVRHSGNQRKSRCYEVCSSPLRYTHQNTWCSWWWMNRRRQEEIREVWTLLLHKDATHSLKKKTLDWILKKLAEH